MFSNLTESGSHASDLKRKGRFFLGTIGFYCLLLVVTGVGSIYAYNVKLDDPSDYEVYALMRFPPVDVSSEPTHHEARPAAANRATQLASRPEISIETPYHGDRIASASTREVSASTPVVISSITSDPVGPASGPIGPDVRGSGGNTNGEGGPVVRETEAPPPPHVVPTPAPAPQRPDGPVHLSSVIISSKAVSKPAPPYPLIAKQAHIQGPIAVQIVIDEQGRVISARATSGQPLLQAAAVQAAYQARFTPTLLGGQPVKVTGSITYNFVLD